MQKEEQIYDNIHNFMGILQKISGFIDEGLFKQTIEFIQKIFQTNKFDFSKTNQAFILNSNEQIELQSIKSYALMMINQFQSSLSIIQICLQKNPLHLASRKRKAVLLEKMGNLEECRKQYHYCLLLQPQSRSIKHKIKRLKMKGTNYSSSCEGWSSDSKESIKEESNSEDKHKNEYQQQKPCVKFGNFQVFDITTEDSDERFAILKEQIRKLSDKKPKKSILKEPMSASIFKEKNYELIKEQLTINTLKKVEQENDFPQQQEKSSLISKLEKKKKKKCKSVSFNDNTNSMEDFN